MMIMKMDEINEDNHNKNTHNKNSNLLKQLNQKDHSLQRGLCEEGSISIGIK